jgi:hypothetical protein
MDTKSLECFGTDPRARGLRIELSPQHSLVLPHEHFVYSELKAEKETDTLRLLFVTHEVTISGYMLRRVEANIQTKELAWIAARPERYRPQSNERAFIRRITIRLIEEPETPAKDEVGVTEPHGNNGDISHDVR